MMRRVNGRPVLYASIFHDGDFWRWCAVDSRGVEYVDGGNFTSLRAARRSLFKAFDSDERKGRKVVDESV